MGFLNGLRLLYLCATATVWRYAAPPNGNYTCYKAYILFSNRFFSVSSGRTGSENGVCFASVLGIFEYGHLIASLEIKYSVMTSYP